MNSQGSMNKEQDVYLGTVDTTATPSPLTNKSASKYSRLYKITAGGPTRGTILLDTVEGPQAGAKVQFVIGEQSQRPSTFSPQDHTAPTIVFNAISDSGINIVSTDTEVKEFENLFLGTSENGFVAKPPSAGVSERPWVCNIPGARYKVQWYNS
ncbi:hypothetical protein FRC12_004135 [Ceratobasidium sp. 428]|nr:hypothetical protein FRC12_004135 [Ceratobasidium sp. 428]